MRILISASILALLLLTGCAHKQGVEASKANHQWSLVRIEIDAKAVANRGSLPMYAKSGGGQFGLEPRASGFMRSADHGKTLVQVDIEEPVVGYTGKADIITYPVVRFFGMPSADGKKIEISDSEAANVGLGVATVLHVQTVSPSLIRIQAATRDRMLPYVYYFDDTPARPAYISVPGAL